MVWTCCLRSPQLFRGLGTKTYRVVFVSPDYPVLRPPFVLKPAEASVVLVIMVTREVRTT